MHILPIASGKGGVGKSLVAVNLSIALAQAGSKVVLADLDLGGSNIHLMLGLPAARVGIGSLITDPGLTIADVITETSYSKLRCIPGDTEIPGLANLGTPEKRRIIRKLLEVDADYLVMDLGAGAHPNIIDFFLAGNRGVIVTTPHQTATLNAYLFLKNAVFRIIWSLIPRTSPAYELLEQTRLKEGSFQRVYIPRLLETLRSKDEAVYTQCSERLSRFRPRLILNMLDDPEDARLADKLKRSAREYLGLEMEHLGIIYRDKLQDIALNSRLPILAYKPDSVLSQAVYRIADKLIQFDREGGEPDQVPADIEDSYQEAQLEAEVDYESKIHGLAQALHCGALSKGDLIETVRMQQFEISRLKKENQLLKERLVRLMQTET